MPRDHQISALLEQMANANAVPLHYLTMPQAREVSAGVVELSGANDPSIASRDFLIPGADGGITVRQYRPVDIQPGSAALIYIHGGGHCLGSLEGYDRICQALAQRLRVPVFSIDYRLAPEHPFPAGPEDCYAAASWIVENSSRWGCDPHKIVVGGDSAGGNLSTVVCQMAKARGGPKLAAQILIYPNTDLTATAYHSKDVENSADPILQRDTIYWFYSHYFTKPGQVEDHRASPILANDLTDLPPAMILTAGFDPLRDEAVAYASRLISAGVSVNLVHYPSLPHAFIQFIGVVDAARDSLDEIATFIRKTVG